MHAAAVPCLQPWFAAALHCKCGVHTAIGGSKWLRHCSRRQGPRLQRAAVRSAPARLHRWPALPHGAAAQIRLIHAQKLSIAPSVGRSTLPRPETGAANASMSARGSRSRQSRRCVAAIATLVTCAIILTGARPCEGADRMRQARVREARLRSAAARCCSSPTAPDHPLPRRRRVPGGMPGSRAAGVRQRRAQLHERLPRGAGGRGRAARRLLRRCALPFACA